MEQFTEERAQWGGEVQGIYRGDKTVFVRGGIRSA